MSEASRLSENKQKLVEDMKVVVTDAEELLRASADVAGEKVAALRERLVVRLKKAKEHILDAEEIVREKAKAAAHATDEYVHDNPWQAVGVAAAVGVLVGFIIGRRD